ncbi:MAG: hypothetical protein JJE52_12300 [Acidimicrobiia bacterium]|nr:hypothetical protein [Acidimicrobiia bacterium]
MGALTNLPDELRSTRSTRTIGLITGWLGCTGIITFNMVFIIQNTQNPDLDTSAHRHIFTIG